MAFKPALLYFLYLALFIPLAGCKEEAPAQISKTDINTISIENTAGQSHHFKIELARSEAAQKRGLMYRDELPKESGMLFYWDGEEAERNFWMRNTLIPLDMIFIRKSGIIHHIHANAKPNDLTTINSTGAVAAVLEINGGLSQKYGIKAGDQVLHPFFTTKK